MKKSTKIRISAYIARAQAAGSTATTLRGAGKYLLTHPGTRLPRMRRLTRAERLIARYAAVARLPRYLSAFDRRLVNASAERKNYLHAARLPIYVRAHYISDALRALPRAERFVRQADKSRGALVEHSKLRAHSYEVAHWGKLRKKYPGEARLTAGIRTTTNGKCGWDCVSWHYADYIYIEPAGHGYAWIAYYVAADGTTHKVVRTPTLMKFSAEGGVMRMPACPAPAQRLPVHIRRRLLRMCAPRVLAVEYDRATRDLMLVESGGEQYHVNYEQSQAASACKVSIARALTAFRARRAEKIEISQSRLSSIFVCLDDSIGAGNCISESEKFAQRIWGLIGADGPAAVRADIIMQERSDAYTRRAVAFAASR